MKKVTLEQTLKMTIIEYFKYMYENIEGDWNVESSLEFFGKGKSNEGTDESKSIKRFYVEPNDKRFERIFLNFDSKRYIESIVWFFDKDKSEMITLNELQTLFGEFKIQNIIYDDTTELIFMPNKNGVLQYISTSIPEWVKMRPNGSLYFKQDNREIDIINDYKVVSLIFKIKKST
jgi:hypothetical protein